jgi:hypothetical protein
MPYSGKEENVRRNPTDKQRRRKYNEEEREEERKREAETLTGYRLSIMPANCMIWSNLKGKETNDS